MQGGNTVKIIEYEDRYAEEISKVRAVLEQEGEPKYKEAKKSLPAIAFCGEFSGGHGKDHLVKYSNLLVFDIDHLTAEEMRKAYLTISCILK